MWSELCQWSGYMKLVAHFALKWNKHFIVKTCYWHSSLLTRGVNCLHLVPKSRWVHGELHAKINDKLNIKGSKDTKIFFQAMRVIISSAMNHHEPRPQCAKLNKGIKSELNLATQWHRISHIFVLNSKGFWVHMHCDQSRKADFFHFDRKCQDCVYIKWQYWSTM